MYYLFIVLKSHMLCFSFIYCFLLLEVSFNLYPVFTFDEVFTSLKRRVYSLVYSLAVVLYISTNLIPLNYIPSLLFSQVYFKLLIDTSPQSICQRHPEVLRMILERCCIIRLHAFAHGVFIRISSLLTYSFSREQRVMGGLIVFSGQCSKSLTYYIASSNPTPVNRIGVPRCCWV